MSMSLFLASAGAFTGGAVTAYLFRRPTLNQSGLQVLGLSGLYGFAIQTASVGCAAISSQKLYKALPQSLGGNTRTIVTYAVTYALPGAILSVATKLFLNCIGISMLYKEVFTCYALSSVFTLLPYFLE